MTEFSGALKSSNFNGNTISLECENNKYTFISVLEIFEIRTHDKIPDYISLMGNLMIPYTFAVGGKYTYFFSTRYKFIENDKIEEGMLLNSSNDSLDPHDYHLSKTGLDCFEKLLESNRTRISWFSMESGDMEEIVEGDENIEDEEDVNVRELEYTD